MGVCRFRRAETLYNARVWADPRGFGQPKSQGGSDMADMAVGVVPGLIVGLREGIEAALVVGIIVAYLTKIDRKELRRYVFIGAGLAMVVSAIVAAVWAVVWGQFGGVQEELFEGVAAIIAVIVLTSMILWMMKAAKDIRRHVEQRIEILVDGRQVMGLASLAFIAVFREGVETVLFMAGLAGQTTPSALLAGGGVGRRP